MKHSDEPEVLGLVDATICVMRHKIDSSEICPRCLFGSLILSSVGHALQNGFLNEQDLFILIGQMSEMGANGEALRNENNELRKKMN